jgi:predicted secreted acid phosphatase
MHLDAMYDNEGDINYVKGKSKESRFLELLKKNKNSLVIVMGDFFNDFQKSIEMIKKIDKLGIKGY